MTDDPETPSFPDESPMVLPEAMPLPVEEFPELIECTQCKRPYRTQQLRTHVNTLLTEVSLSCHRCKRKLRKMRLKDWYDHYIQGQPHQFELDRHGFTHKDPRDLLLPPPPPKANPFDTMNQGRSNNQQPRRDGGRPSRNNHRRSGNRNRNARPGNRGPGRR